MARHGQQISNARRDHKRNKPSTKNRLQRRQIARDTVLSSAETARQNLEGAKEKARELQKEWESLPVGPEKDAKFVLLRGHHELITKYLGDLLAGGRLQAKLDSYKTAA